MRDPTLSTLSPSLLCEQTENGCLDHPLKAPRKTIQESAHPLLDPLVVAKSLVTGGLTGEDYRYYSLFRFTSPAR